jgi:WS/DGAT/MGAT family acyltransferase
LLNLAVETEDSPANEGAVLIVDGSRLPDGGQMFRRQLEVRLAGVPELRRKIYRPGLLGGRPLWIDDPSFDVARHVDQAEVAPPGDEAALLQLAGQLMVPLLDRSKPLWHMWCVTGLPHGRLAVVIKLHHVMADGLAALQLLASIVSKDPAPPPQITAPSWAELVHDNLRTKMGALRQLNIVRLVATTGRGTYLMLSESRNAPRTSLNAPIGPNRRLALLRLDLAEVKQVAHAHGGKVNDVILALATAGLRTLLISRGEPVDGVRLHAGIAVSLRRNTKQADGGNQTGAYMVKLPAGESDSVARLRQIAAASVQAKGLQLNTAGNTFLILLARLGLVRRFTRHQHFTNVMESNIAGPQDRISLLGAPVVDLIPLSNLTGNLALGFLALSYNGRLNLTVQADADSFPDLPVLVDSMRQEWVALIDACDDNSENCH